MKVAAGVEVAGQRRREIESTVSGLGAIEYQELEPRWMGDLVQEPQSRRSPTLIENLQAWSALEELVQLLVGVSILELRRPLLGVDSHRHRIDLAAGLCELATDQMVGLQRLFEKLTAR